MTHPDYMTTAELLALTGWHRSTLRRRRIRGDLRNRRNPLDNRLREYHRGDVDALLHPTTD